MEFHSKLFSMPLLLPNCKFTAKSDGDACSASRCLSLVCLLVCQLSFGLTPSTCYGTLLLEIHESFCRTYGRRDFYFAVFLCRGIPRHLTLRRKEVWVWQKELSSGLTNPRDSVSSREKTAKIFSCIIPRSRVTVLKRCPKVRRLHSTWTKVRKGSARSMSLHSDRSTRKRLRLGASFCSRILKLL